LVKHAGKRNVIPDKKAGLNRLLFFSKPFSPHILLLNGQNKTIRYSKSLLLGCSILEQKIINAALAGTGAGILKDIPDSIIHNILKKTDLTFWDYAGIVMFGRHPQGFWETCFSFFFEIVFSIFLGIIFVCLVNRLNLKRRLLWGAFYGGILWFVIRAAVVGFQIKALLHNNLATSAANSFNSIIYGLILGFFVQYFEKKTF